MLSLKRRLKKQEHGYRVRIRNHLIAQYFPEMDGDYERLGAEGLSVVRWCLPASEIAQLDMDPFIERVSSRRIPMKKRWRLEEIWEKAGESIGCDEVPGLEHEAKVMVEGLKQIREMIKETEQRIEELCKQFSEYESILTIPGFGPDVSAKVLGAIGDPDRFLKGGQVVKLAGFDLSADRSGKSSDKAIPEISKRGKADLRYALYQAALVASSQNRELMIYYTNKIRGREKEKGIHTKMRVKLAAKLLVIAWTLMKKKESYNPAYLKANQTKNILIFDERSPSNNVEAPRTSGGTIQGLSLNFGIWIRDDGWPPPCGIPDNDNAEIQSSSLARESSS